MFAWSPLGEPSESEGGLLQEHQTDWIFGRGQRTQSDLVTKLSVSVGTAVLIEQ